MKLFLQLFACFRLFDIAFRGKKQGAYSLAVVQNHKPIHGITNKGTKLFLLLLLTTGCFSSIVAQQYNITVSTSAIPSISPIISQSINSGNIQSSLLYNLPGIPAGQAAANVYVYGTIERIAPSPFILTTHANYIPQPNFSFPNGMPRQLTALEQQTAFGNFDITNLAVTGISFSEISDGSGNIRLPEGQYKICYYTRQFNPLVNGGVGAISSDPNLGCGNFTIAPTQPLNAISITTTAIPPIGSFIEQAINTGKITSLLNFINLGGRFVNIKLFGKIERVSPAPFTIAVNAQYDLQTVLTISPGIPIQVSPMQLLEAFGNFNDNNLITTGISLNLLKDINGTIKLPDGQYRICLYARYLDPNNGLAGNASDQNLGCGFFTICGSASAPQLTQPVNNLNITSSLANVTPASPIVFAWTVPASTCGGNTGALTYDLEIRELLETQTVTDAINNPPVFSKTFLPSPIFLLDTLLYKNTLEKGKKYVVRIKANAGPNSGIQLENNGFSRIEAFKYGEDNRIVSGNNPLPQPPGPLTPSVNLQAGICSGVIAPVNKVNYAGSITDLKNIDLTIGNFKLHTNNSIKQNSNGTYSGDGYIAWRPLITSIQLRVTFNNIKINTDRTIYEGIVHTTTEPEDYTWTPIAQANDIAKALSAANEKAYKDITQFINDKAKMLNQVLGNTPVDMPLGWNNDIAGVPVTIAIMAVSFSPTGTNMNLFTGVNIPEANGWLNMAGTNFCIQPAGIGEISGTLYFPNDRDFNLGSGANNWNFTFKGCSATDTTKGTYININKGKLEKVMARAEIRFPQDVMIPEDNMGKLQTGPVVSKIQFQFASWNDWVAGIDMPHFQLKDAQGISFHTTKVYYDHSNKMDPAGFKYPIATSVPAGNAFMGLYIAEMKVLLPEEFKTFNNTNKRTSFSASNFVIEKDGISADIQAKNIVAIGVDKTGEGSMGGFAFSLDNFQLIFEKNTFKKGLIDGGFWLPISKTALRYDGNLRVENDSLKYEFKIAPEKNYTIDIWAATVDLKSNSHFQLIRDSKGAAVETVLNGDISFSLSSSPKIEFDFLKFDGLTIGNRNPITKQAQFWFNPGNWAYTGPGSTGGNQACNQYINSFNQHETTFAGPNIGEFYNNDFEELTSKGDQSVGGFPISINNVKPVVLFKSPTVVEAGIGFTINVNIGGKDKTIISATTSLAILGVMEFDITGLKKPGISLSAKVRIDTLKVAGAVGPLKITGEFIFYNGNNTFGDGVKGKVTAKFPIATIEATAQFGNVNNFNYWFIDACATFKIPIPMGGALGLGGFGGGAYYNMNMATPVPDVNNLDQLSLKADSKDMQPGKSMSGISYIPQSGGFGLKASAIITMSSSGNTFNAKVTIGAGFTNGALKNFNLEGQAYFITDYPENKTPAIAATVSIIYDVPEETFSLTAKVDVNVATLKAHIPISVFAGPPGWYIKVGDPFGEKATISIINKKSITYEANLGATAYFAAGTLLDIKLPDLPIEISSKTKRDASTVQLLEAMKKTPADGFMFGARVDGRFRATYAILYAEAKAILGFDLALMHFKEQISCGGSPMGWNNWYAVGQLYAYLSAEVGVQVDVWFFEGSVSLCKIEAGASLQAGLPNPFWAEGTAFVSGEVLGGLVKVSQDFHIKIGDKCYPASDPLKDIQIITDYGPKNNGDVYDDPFLVSNVGLDKDFTLNIPPSEKYPSGELRTYQFKLTQFELYKNGQLINSTGRKIEQDNTVATLKFKDMFAPRTNHTIKYTCEIWQYYPEEGRWDNPYNDKTRKKEQRTERGEFTFKTGDAPEYIRNDIVHLLYPVKYQRYVLRNEFGGKGNISLNRWATNILNANNVKSPKRYVSKYIAVNAADTIYSNFEPDEATNRINFTYPSTLKSNTVYKLELWSLPGTTTPSSIKPTVSNNTRNYGELSIQLKMTKATGQSKRSATTDPIFETYFRTSSYNSLQEKVDAYGNWSAKKGTNYSINIQNSSIVPEAFDDFETKGFSAPDGTNYPPLLHVGINWEKNKQNESFADETIYGPAFTLSFQGAKIQFGVNSARDWLQPVYTLDFSRLPSERPLNNSETNELKSKYMSSAKYMRPSTNSNSTVSKTSSAIKSFAGYASMKWQRDYYVNQDFLLMKDFANGVQPLMVQLQKQFRPNDLENTLDNISDSYEFSTNWLGGSVIIPINKFYKFYNSNTAMKLVNTLRGINFLELQKGVRTLQFQYRLAAIKSTPVNKLFTY